MKLLISKLDIESKQQIKITDNVIDWEPREVKIKSGNRINEHDAYLDPLDGQD